MNKTCEGLVGNRRFLYDSPQPSKSSRSGVKVSRSLLGFSARQPCKHTAWDHQCFPLRQERFVPTHRKFQLSVCFLL